MSVTKCEKRLPKVNKEPKDIDLLNHALGITSSDYDIENSMDKDKPDDYRVKMQRKIERVRKKLLTFVK